MQAAPYRFQFIQAVRLLLIWLRRAGVPPESALRDILRFQNSLSLGFAASEIQSLSLELASDSTADDPIAPTSLSRIRLTPAFIGLLGANGTLPLHYTEHIAAYEHAEQDASVRAYFDLFSDRVVVLFFKAWGKYRVEHSVDLQGEDQFRPLLVSLGARHAGPSRADSDLHKLHADVMAFYIGLLRQRPMSVAALNGILPEYFGVPIAIDQFVGGWDDLADDRQCRMGGANATLGYSGALGMRSWRHDLRVTVRIGPLGKDNFEQFLPGAPGARALEAILTMVGVAALQFMAYVTLKSDDVAPLELVGGSDAGKRLGWDSRIGVACPAQPADVRYMLRPS
jgi:type VI secretion system protein ImpH